MLPEGTPAPAFELPALVDGERRRVALDDYVGEDVVILAFYPADFNPACDAEACDLDELDLFTMQKDVTILGISPDSVYSHRAFADQYDLNVPLLADTDGEVAAKYDLGLTDDIGQHLTERAVVVVDHDGEITYAWSTAQMRKLPRVEEIKDAIAETGGDDTAFARYRVGHAHYTEGRRSFTSAMEGFQNSEWMMAQNDFQQAREEFEEAAAQFDTALRFVDDESLVPIYEDANTKATSLWQAADWLTQAASAYSSGSGAEGQELRDDAERPLETVREYAEPPDPDGEWPPAIDDLEAADDEDHSILPTEPETGDAALDVDIDEQLDAAEEPDVDGDAGDTDDDAGPDDTATADDEAATDGEPEEEDIDDDELAEIQAELAANNPDEEPSVEEITAESTAIVEAPPMGEAEADEDPVAADGAAESDDDEAAESDDGEAGIDDDELTEIQAELAANNPDEEPSVGDLPDEPTTMVDAPPMAETDGEPSATSADATGGDAESDAVTATPADSADGDGDDRTEEGAPADDAAARAKEELAQLQAELGIELPGSDISTDDGDE